MKEILIKEVSMDLFNKNWKHYIAKDETVILSSKISQKIAILFSLPPAIMITLFATIFLSVNKIIPVLPVILIATVIFFVAFFTYHIHYRCMRYSITSHGVHEVKGFIIKTYKFVPFAKITDTKLHRNLLDMIFGTGSIGISTAGGTRSVNGNSQPYEIRFLHIDDFMKMSNEIIKKLK